MKYYLKINNFIMCILIVFLLSACTHKAMEDTKLYETEVQKKNTTQETADASLNHKITQEAMDKLYAYMPYDEMVETVGFEPILFLEDETENKIVYHYNIAGEDFEENNCTLDLTFRDNLLDDALTGYMDFPYPEDTKIVKMDDYCNLKTGDSLKDVREKMGNAMRFNKIFWDDLL